MKKLRYLINYPKIFMDCLAETACNDAVSLSVDYIWRVMAIGVLLFSSVNAMAAKNDAYIDNISKRASVLERQINTLRTQISNQEQLGTKTMPQQKLIFC